MFRFITMPKCILFMLNKNNKIMKLEEMGLVPLNKKECVEYDGGNDKPVIKSFSADDFIVCCINIPPVKFPGDAKFGV